MENLRSALDYIKSFFKSLEGNNRKRRAPEPIDILRSPKFRKTILPYKSTFEDEWFGSPNMMSFRKPQSLLSNPNNSHAPRIIETVILNDDDDVEIKQPDNKQSTRDRLSGAKLFSTSTPTEIRTRSFLNGHSDDDDVKFVREDKSPICKSAQAKKLGFNYIKPGSALFTIGSNGVENGSHNSSHSRKQDYLRHRRRLSSIDNSYSFRLDDKNSYKKLLENFNFSGASSSVFVTPTLNESVYRTPVGKLFDYDISNRSAKIMGLSVNATANDSRKELMSTKDTIKKVLDNFEEPLVVKDSDSDDDVLIVDPPSPKPDIQVDPINSFKTVVDSAASTKRDWLDTRVERNKQYVDKKQLELQQIRDCAEKTSTINKHVNLGILQRKIHECLQIQDAVLPVTEEEEETELPELTDEHLQLVRRALKGDPNEVLVRKFNLNITRRDLITLNGLNWLNDEVINFYMNLITERGQDSKWPNTHTFNTFFYPKLLKTGPESLRRWTKRVDIFEFDLICVPIHLGMHWCMAIIDFRDRSIRYYDSMGSPNNRCIEALRNYLQVEHMDKKKRPFNTDDFVLENVEDIPQQMNGSDCGMFACTFAEYITRNAKITFDQNDMPYMRRKMIVEIMSGELMIK